MDWKSMISKAAPILGTLVGGPVGGAAVMAVKMIAGALGVEDSPDAIEAELKANPEALLKLKELELNNKATLERLKTEQEKDRLTDVSSARSRQTEHEKTTGKSDANLYVLAWTVVFGFFGLMGLLCFRALPNESSSVVFMLFGALATGFGQVLQYFFGSSKSSAEKTTLIANQPKI